MLVDTHCHLYFDELIKDIDGVLNRADKLGVNLIHLNYHDQLKAREGFNIHISHVRKLILELNELINSIQPDVIITWGPDGGTNHLDHMLVSTSVTQVFLSKS